MREARLKLGGSVTSNILISLTVRRPIPSKQHSRHEHDEFDFQIWAHKSWRTSHSHVIQRDPKGLIDSFERDRLLEMIEWRGNSFWSKHSTHNLHVIPNKKPLSLILIQLFAGLIDKTHSVNETQSHEFITPCRESLLIPWINRKVFSFFEVSIRGTSPWCASVRRFRFNAFSYPKILTRGNVCSNSDHCFALHVSGHAEIMRIPPVKINESYRSSVSWSGEPKMGQPLLRGQRVVIDFPTWPKITKATPCHSTLSPFKKKSKMWRNKSTWAKPSLYPIKELSNYGEEEEL